MMIKARDAECYTGLAMAEKRYIEHANQECDSARRALEKSYKATLRALQEKRISNTVQQPTHYVVAREYQTLDRVSA